MARVYIITSPNVLRKRRGSAGAGSARGIPIERNNAKERPHRNSQPRAVNMRAVRAQHAAPCRAMKVVSWCGGAWNSDLYASEYGKRECEESNLVWEGHNLRC